jgi:L-alanine-DL-glutamate epimerase-like enolase superfamily enzyme
MGLCKSIFPSVSCVINSFYPHNGQSNDITTYFGEFWEPLFRIASWEETGVNANLKIVNAEHWSEHLALIRPYRIANKTFNDVENHFVRLEAENGMCGYGSASPSGEVTGESLADCAAALDRHLEERLLGRDLRRFPAVIRELQSVLTDRPGALAAVDIALHDLAGKLLETPLVEILGRCHQSLPTSVTIGIQSVDEALAEAEEYLGQGFTMLKVKIGDCLEDDITLLTRLRQKAGPDIGIRVDANQGYSVDDLLHFYRYTQELNLELIEQPLKADHLEKMRSLPEAIRSRCAGDESLCNPMDAMQCAQTPQPFGIFNIKLMKCGGINPAGQMARDAHLAGIRLMWGCNDESCVSISAALHAALASPATRFLDLDGSFDLGRDLFKGGFVIGNGKLSTTDAPGLGVTPLD